MHDCSAFANRISKNRKHLRKIMQRAGVEAYRLYDRDVPQFPFALDVYGDHVHLQEYDTGWVMLPEEYETWLQACVTAAASACEVPPDCVHVKKRARQRGEAQYEKQAVVGEDLIVSEYGRRFWVNLDKYLDTGLFLDHRNTRRLVGESAAGKRFLNLFAYTGSFSVYAVTGGAVYSETVDLSNTYLEWARRNFALNGIDERAHRTVRADVFAYLAEARQTGKEFDLIVMDPPSFSNSKKMSDILDVQRDHVRLIDGAMALLAADGVLYFSNNLRSFTLDDSLRKKYAVSDVSHQSVPEDFRNKKIHQCWKTKHRR
ncbi:MAG: class I SAM-dependent methyltransferase [Neisseria sp.]|nr:class I SAM-dependent methyltransferase [Neisseria sp.]